MLISYSCFGYKYHLLQEHHGGHKALRMRLLVVKFAFNDEKIRQGQCIILKDKTWRHPGLIKKFGESKNVTTTSSMKKIHLVPGSIGNFIIKCKSHSNSTHLCIKLESKPVSYHILRGGIPVKYFSPISYNNVHLGHLKSYAKNILISSFLRLFKVL